VRIKAPLKSRRSKSGRIGLSEFKQAWIIVSEYNYDILEKSFSLEPPHVPLQKISPGLMKIVLRAFKLTLASGESRRRSLIAARHLKRFSGLLKVMAFPVCAQLCDPQSGEGGQHG
jgi:hypothetical protein